MITYQKARDENHASGISQSPFSFSEEFDQLQGTALSMEPTVLHNGLINWDDSLLTPESSLGPAGSQKMLDQGSEVTLVLEEVPVLRSCH